MLLKESFLGGGGIVWYFPSNVNCTDGSTHRCSVLFGLL